MQSHFSSFGTFQPPSIKGSRRDFLTHKRNKLTKKIVTFMWYSNDTFHYMFKAEYVTLVILNVPSGSTQVTNRSEKGKWEEGWY